MRENRKLVCLVLMLILVFTSIPMGSFAVVSKPGKVKVLGKPKFAKDNVTMTIKINKVPKCDGLRLFSVKENGKLKLVKTYPITKKLKKNKQIKYKIGNKDSKIIENDKIKYEYIVRAYKKNKRKYIYSARSSRDLITVEYDNESEEPAEPEEQPKGEGNSDGGGTHSDAGGTPDAPSVNVGPSKPAETSGNAEQGDNPQKEEQKEEQSPTRPRKDTETERIRIS